MLCLRCILFTVLVLLSLVSADPRHNLLTIQAVVIGLLTLIHFTGFIYQNFYLDVLEASFILNLGILAAATYSVGLTEIPESRTVVTYISVGIAFATFIGVLVYHTYQQVWPKLQQRFHKLRNQKENQSECFDKAAEFKTDIDNKVQVSTAPTMTIVECPPPEPCISTDITITSSNKVQPLISPTSFIELREPLNMIDTGH